MGKGWSYHHQPSVRTNGEVFEPCAFWHEVYSANFRLQVTIVYNYVVNLYITVISEKTRVKRDEWQWMKVKPSVMKVKTTSISLQGDISPSSNITHEWLHPRMACLKDELDESSGRIGTSSTFNKETRARGKNLLKKTSLVQYKDFFTIVYLLMKYVTMKKH
jgi:hypothetical protein